MWYGKPYTYVSTLLPGTGLPGLGLAHALKTMGRVTCTKLAPLQFEAQVHTPMSAICKRVRIYICINQEILRVLAVACLA